MNTPAHLIFAATAFGGKTNQRVLGAAVLGGFLPDLSLYALAGISIFALGIDPHVVFDQLYFSDAWQQVFAIDNSFILWGIALFVAWRLGSVAGMALCAGALLHLAFDLPLHREDARMHFWPLTDWKYVAPFSYWDSDGGARWISAVETTVTLAMVVILWRRWRHWGWRIGFAVLGLMQIATSGMWSLVF